MKSQKIIKGIPTYERGLAIYQKISALVKRLGRYNKSYKRRTQNIELRNNENKFYKKLEYATKYPHSRVSWNNTEQISGAGKEITLKVRLVYIRK